MLQPLLVPHQRLNSIEKWGWGGQGRKEEKPHLISRMHPNLDHSLSEFLLLFHMQAAGPLKHNVTEWEAQVLPEESFKGAIRKIQSECVSVNYKVIFRLGGQAVLSELNFPHNSDPLCHLTNNLLQVLIEMLFSKEQHLIINTTALFILFQGHFSLTLTLMPLL